jgi:hypothetical protein
LLGSLWFNSFSSGAGASADYELISTTVLGSDTASVTFTGLGTSAAAYKHLQLRGTIRATSSSASNYGFFRVNGDTGANYAGHRLSGNGSSVSSGADTSQTGMYVGDFPAGTNTSGNFGAMIVDYLDFSNTSKNKTMRYSIGFAGTSPSIHLRSGLWMSTAAITSLSFAVQDGSNWLTGSRFSLYGLK